MTLVSVLAQLHRVIREWWDREREKRIAAPRPIVEQIQIAWGRPPTRRGA